MTVPSGRSDPLPLRWALILLIAVVVAALAGGLTFAHTADWPAAMLAALGAAGAAVPVSHEVLGSSV
jgi:hypothetical protein